LKDNPLVYRQERDVATKMRIGKDRESMEKIVPRNTEMMTLVG